MPNESEYRITGQVVNKRTGRGVRGVRVEAWDRDTKYHDLLGVETTDAAGRFDLRFDSAYFGDHAPDRLPDVFFKVFRGRKLLHSTEETTVRNLRDPTSDVTIELDLPERGRPRPDRVRPERLMSAAAFVRKSDFRAIQREGRARGRAVAGLMADAVRAAFAGGLSPIGRPAVATSDVVGANLAEAERRLASRQVTVRRVKPYDPGVGAAARGALAALPRRLSPGDRVDLYEENGKVRYYTVVPAAELEPDAAEIDRIDRQVGELRGEVREVDAVRSELANVRTSSEARTTALDREVEALKAQLAEVSAVRKELDSLRVQAVAREQELSSLREEVAVLRTRQPAAPETAPKTDSAADATRTEPPSE